MKGIADEPQYSVGLLDGGTALCDVIDNYIDEQTLVSAFSWTALYQSTLLSSMALEKTESFCVLCSRLTVVWVWCLFDICFSFCFVSVPVWEECILCSRLGGCNEAACSLANPHAPDPAVLRRQMQQQPRCHWTACFPRLWIHMLEQGNIVKGLVGILLAKAYICLKSMLMLKVEQLR